MQGTYKGVQLVESNWFEMYNYFASNDQRWENMVTEDAIDDIAEDLQYDPDYIPSPAEQRRLAQNQGEFRMELRSRVRTDDGQNDVDDSIIDCIKQGRIYVNALLSKLYGDDNSQIIIADESGESSENEESSNHLMDMDDDSKDETEDVDLLVHNVNLRVNDDLSSVSSLESASDDWIPNVSYNTKFDDSPFRGVCVPEMIDTLIKYGVVEGVARLKFTDTGKLQRFMSQYQQHRDALEYYDFKGQQYHHPLFPLFDFPDNVVEESYHRIRNWIISQLQINYTQLIDTKKRNKFEKKLFDNLYHYICDQHKCIKYIWTLQISYLFTESIVESICSIIKAHYNYNRERLQGKRLKVLLKNIIMLPDDGTNRTRIVK